jgi:hypothetical protein
LLIQDKKKVIVNVDRIKPYRIPDAQPDPEVKPKAPPNNDAVYQFDVEKFVPYQEAVRLEPKTDFLTPEESPPNQQKIPPESTNDTDPIMVETRMNPQEFSQKGTNGI